VSEDLNDVDPLIETSESNCGKEFSEELDCDMQEVGDQQVNNQDLDDNDEHLDKDDENIDDNNVDINDLDDNDEDVGNEVESSHDNDQMNGNDNSGQDMDIGDDAIEHNAENNDKISDDNDDKTEEEDQDDEDDRIADTNIDELEATEDNRSTNTDQDTEGDEINDAEEIEAGDSLEETEFVDGGPGDDPHVEETQLVDTDGHTDIDPLVEEGEAGDDEDPLVDDGDALADEEHDALGEDEALGDEEHDALGDEEQDPLLHDDMNGELEDVDPMDGDMALEDTEMMEDGESENIDQDATDGLSSNLKRKSDGSTDADVPVRKSSRIKLLDDLRKEKKDEGVHSVHDKQQEKTKMLQKPSERPTRISEDEAASQSDAEEKDEEIKEGDEGQPEKTKPVLGDPSKAPGVGAARKIDMDFLLPFQLGWTREVCVRPTKSGPQQIDIFYWPPKSDEDFGARSQGAHRKRRSKVDMEKYFEEFKHQTLCVNNFTFVRRALQLNNEAYEIVRHSKPSLETRSDKRTRAKSVRYKEVAEHEGLLSGSSSEGEEDEEIEDITDFDQGIPLSLQVISRTTPFREESNKRKKFPDRERCITPPTAAELEWTLLDDDPLGIYTELGGRSSPATPPPLRAVRLTSHNTVTSASQKLEQIKKDLVDPLIRVMEHNKDMLLKENLVSHDLSIKKYKNMRMPSSPFSVNSLNNKKTGVGVPRLGQGKPGSNQKRSTANLAQGVVKVKLPILSTNGKRPSVELVMLTNAKYQPIKFTNNRQVTESIPKRLFDQANALRKTLYQRSVQVPKIGSKPVFVAVNPSQHGYKPFVSASNASNSGTGRSVTQPKPPTVTKPTTSEQVSILVRPAQGGNNVLLNVPKNVALKVKKGTTLSFSASSDQKYIVVDAKMHPAVGKKAEPIPPPQQRRSLPNLPAGVSIRPISRVNGGSKPPRPSPGHNNRNHQQPKPIKRSSTGSTNNKPPPPLVDLTDFSPCSPFCPGVSGIPELECCVCHSLFHPKCVGIPNIMVNQIRDQFKCKGCRQQPGQNPIQVIELD